MPHPPILITSLLLAALALTACKPDSSSQSPASGPEEWQAFRSDSGKWGFQEYDYAESFEKGHAIVKKGEEIGYVSPSGEFKAGDHPNTKAEAADGEN